MIFYILAVLLLFGGIKTWGYAILFACIGLFVTGDIGRIFGYERTRRK